MRRVLMSMILALGVGCGTQAWAGDVAVKMAWVRGTVAAQKATGAFMQLTAPEDMRLVGASTPVAGVTEVHEMRMEGEIMKMRPIRHLALPAGQPVELKPGGYHVMLMGLKSPLSEGQTVPITLKLEAADGRVREQVVEAQVKALTSGAMEHGGKMRGHMH